MLIGLRGLLFCLLLFTPSMASTAPDIAEDGSEQVYHMVARVGQSNARRQDDAAFNDMNGDITNNCRNAPTYKISKGTLSSTLNNVDYYYTTNPGVALQLFVPSTTLGNITQSFMLGTNGAIVWRNAAFDTGQAQFCSTYNGSMYAVFRTAAIPDGCALTSLFLFGASSCPDIDRVSTLVQTQSTFIVSTAYRIVVSTEPRTITTTERDVSTYVTTYERIITSTYRTYLDAATVTATYQTTIPASTQYFTSIQPASTVTNTETLTYITTYITTQPASTYRTTAVITQSASTLTTTYQVTTTYPAQTVVQTVTYTGQTVTTTRIGTTTVSPITQTKTLPANTVTATVTANPKAPAPSLCGNQGMEYAVFANNPSYASTGSGSYNPEFMKSPSAGGTWTQIYYNSTYDTISGADNYCTGGEGTNGTIYGRGTTFNCREFSIDHRFYMYVYATGNWTIKTSSIDDSLLGWHGATAYQGWTKANAEFNVVYNPGNIGTFFWNNLNVGDYIPIRMAYGNYGGGASFIITILDPFGAVAFDSYTRNSPYIVRYSCDGTTAPPFSYAFGQEL